MATYNWTVSALDCYPKYEGHTDVVFTVYWALVGVEGKYTSSIYSSTAISSTVEEPYTPYADLTEAQVIGWVKDALGEDQVAEYEKGVSDQIAALANPPVVTPPLPWAPASY